MMKTPLAWLVLLGCATSTVDSALPMWMTTTPIDDGCLMLSGLLDGPYQSEEKVDGGTEFTWDDAAANQNGLPMAAAPGPFHCETGGDAVACWPYLIGRTPDVAHPNGYPWSTTARITGTLTETTLDGQITFLGRCLDSAGCVDPAGMVTLPCESTFGLSGVRPVPEQPGACPAQDDSSLGEPAHIDIYNYTGQEVGVSWATVDGVVRSTLGSGEGPSSWPTFQGVWWRFTDAYDTEDCRSAILIDQATVTVELRRL